MCFVRPLASSMELGHTNGLTQTKRFLNDVLQDENKGERGLIIMTQPLSHCMEEK